MEMSKRKYVVEYYSEICCDICNDIIHNHFDCPICHKEGASTSAYCQIEIGEEIDCEECGAKFTVIAKDWDKMELKERIE